MPAVKELAKKSRPIVIAAAVADDVRAQLQARRGSVVTDNGATHASMRTDESLAYIDTVYEDYIRYGGLEPDDIRGARVLELGPGDNFGVAMRFLAAGAEHVTCLDKFFASRDAEHQKELDAALLESLDPDSRARASDPDRLRYVHGVGIEEAETLFEPGSFDLIVSRAVLEHLYDLDAAFTAMDRLLVPGGRLLHKVDFRDHGMFTAGGGHPLEFLTISDRVYKRMTYHSGRPNRRLIDWYRDRLNGLGHEHELLVTHVVGRSGDVVPHPPSIDEVEGVEEAARELIPPIRPRLAPRYESLSDADLMVSGIFLSSRKPD